jgi:hypothetical protein
MREASSRQRQSASTRTPKGVLVREDAKPLHANVGDKRVTIARTLWRSRPRGDNPPRHPPHPVASAGSSPWMMGEAGWGAIFAVLGDCANGVGPPHPASPTKGKGERAFSQAPSIKDRQTSTPRERKSASRKRRAQGPTLHGPPKPYSRWGVASRFRFPARCVQCSGCSERCRGR